MRNFFTKYKSAIILLVIILVGFWLYSLFFPQLQQAFQTSNDVVGEELFATLNTIESLTLNNAIFDDSDYMRLRDQETIIGAQRAGRSNPFAPTGGDVGGTLREPTRKNTVISNAETFLEIDMEEALGNDTATSSPAE